MQDNHTLYALFNSKTRQLTCFVFDLNAFPEVIRNNFLIKSYPFEELGISDNEINLQRFKWVGDYDNGKLVDIVKENKSVVSEKDLEEKYRSIFWSKYNMEEIVYELILNSDMKTEKGKSIQNFLSKILEKKEKDTEFFKNSPVHIWESKDEVLERERKAFKNDRN